MYNEKFPLLYPYFYPCPTALWTSLLLENNHKDEYGLEIPTNLQSLRFHGPEKAIKLAKQSLKKT